MPKITLNNEKLLSFFENKGLNFIEEDDNRIFPETEKSNDILNVLVDYLDDVVSRVTAIGVVYLIVVCVLPIILNTRGGMPLMIGGTSVLIVAGVVLDTMNQIKSYLVEKQYNGVVNKGQKKGRFRG